MSCWYLVVEKTWTVKWRDIAPYLKWSYFAAFPFHILKPNLKFRKVVLNVSVDDANTFSLFSCCQEYKPIKLC